jgi:hypothetical protein
MSSPLPFSFGFGFGALVWHVQMKYESIWLSFFRGEFFCVWFNSLIEDERASSVVDYV